MKNFTKILVIAIVGLAYSANAFSQATATASAVIVTPMTITKVSDLSFGNVSAGASAGTVVYDPVAGTRSKTGGVTLTTPAGTTTLATFTVTGVSGYAYSVTLPPSVTISSGVNNMTVDTFTSDAAATLSAASITLSVGATLNVNASQASGSYTSASTFTVTVAYN